MLGRLADMEPPNFPEGRELVGCRCLPRHASLRLGLPTVVGPAAAIIVVAVVRLPRRSRRAPLFRPRAAVSLLRQLQGKLLLLACHHRNAITPEGRHREQVQVHHRHLEHDVVYAVVPVQLMQRTVRKTFQSAQARDVVSVFAAARRGDALTRGSLRHDTP